MKLVYWLLQRMLLKEFVPLLSFMIKTGTFKRIPDFLLLALAPLFASPPKIVPIPVVWRTDYGFERYSRKRPDSVAIVRKRAFTLRSRRIRILWLENLWILLEPWDEGAKSIYLTGMYEPNEFRAVADLLGKGMTFVDVGANVGLYTLFAARKVGERGQVISIEPSAREFRRLQANVKLNRLRNVLLLKLAMSDTTGERDLLVATKDHSGHNTFGYYADGVTQLDYKERVQTSTIDGIVARERVRRVDFLKLDIEGGEFFALEGSINTVRKDHPVILIEVSPPLLANQNCTSVMIYDYLLREGYSLYYFDSEKPTRSGARPLYEGDVLAIPQVT